MVQIGTNAAIVPSGTIWRAAFGTFCANVPNATHELRLAAGRAGKGAT